MDNHKTGSLARTVKSPFPPHYKGYRRFRHHRWTWENGSCSAPRNPNCMILKTAAALQLKPSAAIWSLQWFLMYILPQKYDVNIEYFLHNDVLLSIVLDVNIFCLKFTVTPFWYVPVTPTRKRNLKKTWARTVKANVPDFIDRAKKLCKWYQKIQTRTSRECKHRREGADPRPRYGRTMERAI